MHIAGYFHMETNKISISLRGNDTLAAILAGASTGDQITLNEVLFTVDESTQELVTGSIDQIEDAKMVKKENPDDDEETKEKNKKSPVMMVMASDDASHSSSDAFAP